MDIAAEKAYPSAVTASPLLPLILLSLASQKHTPNTASDILNEYDYIIVGAGSAGSVLANRLSEKECVNVLLLEAGKPPPMLTDVPALTYSYTGSDIDWNYSTEPQEFTGYGQINRTFAWHSGKTIGGSSTINTMYAIRGNRRDFDGWAADGCTGWSYEEVKPYFKKMENYTDPQFRSNGYHGTSGPLTIENLRYYSKVKAALSKAAVANQYRFVDVNGKSQTGFYKVTQTNRDGRRCSTGKAYLVPAENRTNLDILPNAMVTKILIHKHHATGVRFDFQNQTYEVNARKEVILSAGAAESPKLLMLSGIGPAAELQKWNIPLISNLPVGENLQDHIGVSVNFELDETKITPVDKRITNETINEYISNRSGPLTYLLGLLAFLKNPTSKSEGDSTDFNLIVAELPVGDGIRQFFNLEQHVYNRVYKPYEGKPIYMCFAYATVPESRGTLKLRSASPYDKPVMDPRYFEKPLDVNNTVAGMKTCLKLGTSEAMSTLGSKPFKQIYPGCESYPINSDDYFTCVVRLFGCSIFHKVGTVKMGRLDDPTAVVDPELKVKNIGGLRVVDASIMPTVTSGNTNLPTIMIAEKASDMIKKDILCSCQDAGYKLFKIRA